MTTDHRVREGVERIVLDLDAPTESAQPHAAGSRGRRTLAWALVGIAVTGLAVSMTQRNDSVRHDGPQRLAIVGDAARPGPTVSVGGYAFTLPSGLTVTRQGRVGSVSSHLDFVDALGRHAGIDVTVMRGRVAARRAGAPPPAPMRVTRTRIGGFPATVDRFGADASGPSQIEVRVRVAPRVLMWVEAESISSDDVVAMLTGALR
jgi:hypothetical protein